jgi:hypothetical protein
VSADSCTDSLVSAVEGYADACLADLRKAGAEPRAVLGARSGGGWTVLLVAMPTPPPDDGAGLTECDRDCLALLARATEPLSAARVRRSLEKQGVGIHAEITVKRSLARLRKRGVVCNSRTRPRGYYLPNNLPLFGVRPALLPSAE